MARTNVPTTFPAPTTHEGGRAERQPPAVQLERTVAACLLGETTFYEGAEAIAQRIAALCTEVPPETVAALAVKARTDYKLRHAPLWLAVQLAIREAGRPHEPWDRRALIGDTVAQVVRRPDEAGELVAMFWKATGGRKSGTLTKQIKRGLAQAFTRWDEYQLAKWNRDAPVTLRDVLFLCHAKPRDEAQAALWTRLVDGTLATPDTWEVALSSGANKRETWTRLLTEDRLGDMALLQNLRNMTEAQVDRAVVEAALARLGTTPALPFRFLAAAKAAPGYEDALSQAMVWAAAQLPPLAGTTYLVVDVSGSMDNRLSQKGALARWEAAAALAVILRESAASVRVWSFSFGLVEVPNRRGLPLIEAVGRSQAHNDTRLGAALAALAQQAPRPDRLIVVTDEQVHDTVLPPEAGRGYVINVAPYKPGLPTYQHGWTRLNGFSERVLEWIRVEEAQG